MTTPGCIVSKYEIVRALARVSVRVCLCVQRVRVHCIQPALELQYTPQAQPQNSAHVRKQQNSEAVLVVQNFESWAITRLGFS